MQMLVSKGAQVDLREAVQEAARLQPLDLPDAAKAEVVDFLQRRLEQMLVSPWPCQLLAALGL